MDRRLGIDRDSEGVVGPIAPGIDHLQLLEDSVGLLDTFWGRHLATLVRRNPSRLSFLLIVCWVGNSASVYPLVAINWRRTSAALIRVKRLSVWNLGSAWLWPSAILRISSS